MQSLNLPQWQIYATRDGNTDWHNINEYSTGNTTSATSCDQEGVRPLDK